MAIIFPPATRDALKVLPGWIRERQEVRPSEVHRFPLGTPVDGCRVGAMTETIENRAGEALGSPDHHQVWWWKDAEETFALHRLANSADRPKWSRVRLPLDGSQDNWGTAYIRELVRQCGGDV